MVGSRFDFVKILILSMACWALNTDPILAQESIGFDDRAYGVHGTTRSFNVDAQLAENKDWCEYSVAKAMKDYMHDRKRESTQDYRILLGGKNWSCGLSEPCKATWNMTEKFLTRLLAQVKEFQLKNLDQLNRYVKDYNQQAVQENKPLKRAPVSFQQLRGTKDLDYAQFIYVPLNAFSTPIRQLCNTYFADHDLPHEITTLEEENAEQDKAYQISNWFRLGLLSNLHYHHQDIAQNWIVFAPEEEIYRDYVFFNFLTQKIGVVE